MKKLIVLILMVIFIPAISFAGVKLLNKTLNDNIAPFAIRTFCVDGYKFLHTNKARNTTAGPALSMAIVQMFEERDGKSLPAKC